MKKTILIIIIFIIGFVILLEIASRVYKCEEPPQKTFFPCSLRPYPQKSLIERNKLIADLKEKRLNNEKISKQEYSQSADTLILEVEPEKLGDYFNGYACENYGYVRNDLPEQIEKFVKRHELEHLLQTSKEKNSEFSANLAAGKEYPLGLFQTIFFSFRNRARYYYDSPFCYILSLWDTFKIYFLPFGY